MLPFRFRVLSIEPRIRHPLCKRICRGSVRVYHFEGFPVSGPTPGCSLTKMNPLAPASTARSNFSLRCTHLPEIRWRGTLCHNEFIGSGITECGVFVRASASDRDKLRSDVSSGAVGQRDAVQCSTNGFNHLKRRYATRPASVGICLKVDVLESVTFETRGDEVCGLHILQGFRRTGPRIHRIRLSGFPSLLAKYRCHRPSAGQAANKGSSCS